MVVHGQYQACRGSTVTTACHICEDCGSAYERTTEKLIWRDTDEYKCEVCGKVLEAWNGSRVPRFRLVKRGNPSKKGR
jgi:hypothetical protein